MGCHCHCLYCGPRRARSTKATKCSHLIFFWIKLHFKSPCHAPPKLHPSGEMFQATGKPTTQTLKKTCLYISQAFNIAHMLVECQANPIPERGWKNKNNSTTRKFQLFLLNLRTASHSAAPPRCHLEPIAPKSKCQPMWLAPNNSPQKACGKGHLGSGQTHLSLHVLLGQKALAKDDGNPPLTKYLPI